MSDKSDPRDTFTKIPNALLALLPEMKEAELKVVLAVARQTVGWRKEADRLSLSQLEQMTGLSRQGVINGIEAAMERGILERTANGQGYIYALLVNEVDQSASEVVNDVDQQLVNTVDQSIGGLVNDVDHLSNKLVNDVDTQKKVRIKEKDNGRSTREAKPLPQAEPPPTPTPVDEHDAIISTLREINATLTAPLGRKTINGMAAALVSYGRTAEEVRALWRDCEAGDQPVGALVKAIRENDGLPYNFAGRAKKGPELVYRDGRYWRQIPGFGWQEVVGAA